MKQIVFNTEFDEQPVSFTCVPNDGVYMQLGDREPIKLVDVEYSLTGGFLILRNKKSKEVEPNPTLDTSTNVD